MQITIVKPGMLSTIQDLGRTAHRSAAVPVAGAMDRLSARLANKALGNIDEAAVIEFTYADATFTADQDLLVAYSGSGALFTINGKTLPSDSPLFIPAGLTINLINNPSGSRTYLAVAGGWQVPTILGSKSTYLGANFGGFNGRPLQTNDIIKNNEELSNLTISIWKSLSGTEVNFPKWKISGFFPRVSKEIRIVPGPEFNLFDAKSILNFLSTSYTISTQGNRMGYHLVGEPIRLKVRTELISTAVTFGTIQVTGNGTLILLMADAQTTGGYPRIGQVAAVDLPSCAQLKPNDTLFFTEISSIQAEQLYLTQELQLNQLTTAINLKY